MNAKISIRDHAVRWLPVAVAGLVGFSWGRWGVEPAAPMVDVEEHASVSLETPEKGTAKAKLPNVILVTVDTLRADHVGAYGAARPTSPFIDGLARDGVLFAQAYASSSWTVPSMASLFTSLHAFQHNVDRGGVVNGAVTKQPGLSRDLNTLAERMQTEGYTTFGVATNVHLSEVLGFAQGFDHFVNEGFNNANWVHQAVNDWKTELDSSAPYFLWLHYFDPHDRYTARRPWAEKFDLLAAEEVPELAAQSARQRDKRFGRWSRMTMRKLRKKTQAEDDPVVIETLKVLYDSEIRYTDTWLKRTLQMVDPDEKAVVIITSDHGEEFREHGNLGHRNSLYNELTLVPLIVRAKGTVASGVRVTEPVTTMDLLPTLVEMASGAAPSEDTLAGTSLWSTLTEGTTPGARPLIQSVRRGGELLRAVVEYPLRLIYNTTTGDMELYDLATDVGETKNLAEDRLEDASRLVRTIDRMVSEAVTYTAPLVGQELDPETIEHLQGLGYIDSVVPAPDESRGLSAG